MEKINASIVLYHNKKEQSSKLIHNLLNTRHILKLYLIDNSSNNDLKELSGLDNRIEYTFNNGNLGFGKAHNIALRKSIGENDPYHLVLNPDTTHGNYSGNNQSNPDSIVNKRQLFHKPVRICRNVWIGESVSILPGVEIGENSIVGANSVVTKSFPCNVIIAGNPAKIIKRYNFKTNKWERTNDKGDFINE